MCRAMTGETRQRFLAFVAEQPVHQLDRQTAEEWNRQNPETPCDRQQVVRARMRAGVIKVKDSDDYRAYMPTPRRIAEACMEIRRTWTQRQHYERAGIVVPEWVDERAGVAVPELLGVYGHEEIGDELFRIDD